MSSSVTSSSAKPPGRDRQVVGITVAGIFFCLLLGGTIYASSIRNILDNGHLVKDAWFQVTLLDAYLGFLLFFGWLCSHEVGWGVRICWLMLILIFGNMAACLYVMIHLWRRRPISMTSDHGVTA